METSCLLLSARGTIRPFRAPLTLLNAHLTQSLVSIIRSGGILKLTNSWQPSPRCTKQLAEHHERDRNYRMQKAGGQSCCILPECFPAGELPCKQQLASPFKKKSSGECWLRCDSAGCLLFTELMQLPDNSPRARSTSSRMPIQHGHGTGNIIRVSSEALRLGEVCLWGPEGRVMPKVGLEEIPPVLDCKLLLQIPESVPLEGRFQDLASCLL